MAHEVDVSAPSYWECQDTTDTSVHRVPVPLEPLQELVDSSRLTGAPDLRILEAIRIEKFPLWKKYATARGRISQRLDGPVGDFCSVADHLIIKAELNEVYLFCELAEDEVEQIAKSGFVFGQAYLSDASITEIEALAAVSGSMLLCRVTCGEVFDITDLDLADIGTTLNEKDIDCLVGCRGAPSGGTYREFTHFDQKAIYPEYILRYQAS